MALRCQLGTQTCHTLFRFFQQPGLLRALFVEDLQPLLRTFDEFQRLFQLDPKWNALCGCFGLLQRVLEHLELGSRILSQHFESTLQLLNSLLSGRNDLFRRTTCWRIATGLCWSSRAAVWIAPATWSCCWCHTLPFPFCWWGHCTEGGRGPRMTSNQPSGTDNELHPLRGILRRLAREQNAKTTPHKQHNVRAKWLEPKWLEPNSGRSVAHLSNLGKRRTALGPAPFCNNFPVRHIDGTPHHSHAKPTVHQRQSTQSLRCSSHPATPLRAETLLLSRSWPTLKSLQATLLGSLPPVL